MIFANNTRHAIPLKLLSLLLVCFGFLLLPVKSLAEPDHLKPDQLMIRVRLFDTQPETRIHRLTLSGNYRMARQSSLQNLSASQTLSIEANAGRLLIKASNGQPVANGGGITLQALSDTVGVCVTPNLSEPQRRCYAGELWIRADGNRLLLENIVSPIAYVSSVSASELIDGWPLEAIKAQAVLTQTRLMRKSVRRNLISVSDSTSDEAYLGIRKNPLTQKAVKSVWGKVLTYGNKPIEAYYHSTCGGHTSDDGYFSGTLKKRHAYSIGVTCPYCAKSPFYKTHTVTIPIGQWQAVFGKTPLRLEQKDSGGRYRQARLTAQLKNAYVFWLRLGQSFGWDKAPGTRFEISQDTKGVSIASRGAGHGVGLCQWGARGMALEGKRYDEILKFYYPKTSLKPKTTVKPSV